MYEYRFGGKSGKRRVLDDAPEFAAVRMSAPGAVEALESALEAIDEVEKAIRFVEAGLIVLRSTTGDAASIQTGVLESLDDETDLLPAGRVLKDEANDPVLYTRDLFIQFAEDADDAEIDALLAPHPVVGRQPFELAPNSFYLTVEASVGAGIFQIADDLLNHPRVELAHPELLREYAHRSVTLRQWHLQTIEKGGMAIEQHCNALEAWEEGARGDGITIAIIDDGVDTEHKEFKAPGKVAHPYDAHTLTSDPRPLPGHNHGTACAGVACAAGVSRAAGVAPNARLMPIRMISVGGKAEVRAIEWAVDHGADVISCSWGPPCGRWWLPSDPNHEKEHPLPDPTRAAFTYALEKGRGGKGCVIVWAAGNGNESVDLDGYAAHPDVIAVAAHNDRGFRSVYSDFGDAIWCTFPSDDSAWLAQNHPAPHTPGIWTTDRSGYQGYNKGHSTPGDNDEGDADGHYTATFGGTSSACPGVAGIAALMLSANPDLSGAEVKDLLKRSCAKIDEAGGGYDKSGHSKSYGYGRPDAAEAVRLARGT